MQEIQLSLTLNEIPTDVCSSLAVAMDNDNISVTFTDTQSTNNDMTTTARG